MSLTPKIVAPYFDEAGYWQDERGVWQKPFQNNENGITNGNQKIAVDDQVAETARKYVATMEGSISGAHGHDKCWLVAQVLLRGWSLSEEQAWPILIEFNDRCQPKWSESELRHKVESVQKNSKAPYCWILNKSKFANPNRVKDYYRSDKLRAEDHIEENEEPIKDSDDEVAPFPVNALPKALRDFCDEIATSMSCPVDFPAVTMLAIAGSALGNAVAVRVKNEWYESGRFYIAIVAPPGSAKTPAMNIICKPVYAQQKKETKSWRDLLEDWEDRNERYEKAKKDTKTTANDVISAKPGARPQENHVYTSDATVEGLSPILKNCPRGIAVIRDEITAWVLGMNQYKGGKGNDRQFWLSTWSASNTKIDRAKTIETGSVQIENPFVNVFGSIQPDMLDELCDAKHREDGFVHRLLFCYPVVEYGASWTEVEPSDESKGNWEKVVNELYGIPFEPEKGPLKANFTAEGKFVFREVWNKHRAEVRSEGFNFSLQGPWAKLEQYFPRLAMTIHAMRRACRKTIGNEASLLCNLDKFQPGEVPDENDLVRLCHVHDIDCRCEMPECVPCWDVDYMSVFAAAALIDYFKSHLRRVYRILKSSPADQLAERVVAWLAKRGGQATARELQQVHFVKKRTEAIALIKDLFDRGLVTIVWKDESKNKIASFKLKTFVA